MKLRAALLCLSLMSGAGASAQTLPDAFTYGPVFEEFGPSAPATSPHGKFLKISYIDIMIINLSFHSKVFIICFIDTKII